MYRRSLALLLVAVGIAATAYAWHAMRAAPPATTARPAPPPEVGVITVTPQTVELPLIYAGRVAGVRDVEIRSQVGGILLKREYAEGARVKEDEVLFRIDPRPYQVALDRAQAQLAQAQANFVQAEQNFRRVEELAIRQVTTQKQLDDARGARDAAEASVKLAQAEVGNATLNLGYTTIKAPVAGMTSLRSPPEGTLILAQQTLLTTITPLDPAYVHFALTDADYQSLRSMNRKRAVPIARKDVSVELHYAEGTKHPHTGKLDLSASIIDSQTGTIQFRAIFPNADGTILPGQFVRVRLHGVTLPDAIIIPKQAVMQGPRGASVYVLGADDRAEARPIKIGRELDAGVVIEDGLKAGEQLMVDGVMRVRPRAPVRPVPANLPSREGNPPKKGAK